MTPEKNNRVKNEVSKVKSKVAKTFLRVGLATSMIFGAPACVPTEAISIIPTGETASLPSSDSTKTPEPLPTEARVELTPVITNPATQELTLVPEIEEATEAAPSGLIKIDMDNIIYPPVGYVKEYFEKGEYDAGVETIKKWVGVWEKMGVFEELEIENSSLSLVPLDGRARIVCVRTSEEAPLLCPPIDLINGGLKAVPEEGKWDETDMPLMVSLERLEELISKGSETDMAYQFIDKYQKLPIKYVDPKTGQIVEGEYLAPSEEIILPDIVPEKMNSIGEYDLGMEFIDSQSVYRMFVEGFLSNEEANGDYWRDLLNGNVTYDAFMSYLRNNVGGPENKNYWWPMTSPNGIDFKPYGGYFKSNNEISYTNKRAYGEGVYLDGFYYSFFTYSQYDNSPVLNRFVDEIMKENYLNSLYPLTNFNDFGSSFYKPNKFFGLLLKNNHFIFMIGSMALPGPVPEEYEDAIIGFNNEGRIEDVDLQIVSSVILTYIKGMYDWSGKDRAENKFYCTTGAQPACDNGISYENTIPIVKFR